MNELLLWLLIIGFAFCLGYVMKDVYNLIYNPIIENVYYINSCNSTEIIRGVK